MISFSAFRYIHRVVSLVFAIPLLVIFATGILLTISPKVSVLQPPAAATSTPGILISFDQILDGARSVPEAKIESWSDVAQVDARPSAGIVRVRAKNYWEVQIDGSSGLVLGAAPRWKTLLILLHDGSWFSSWVKYGVYLPAGIGVLVLWISGLALWAIPKFFKRRS